MFEDAALEQEVPAEGAHAETKKATAAPREPGAWLHTLREPILKAVAEQFSAPLEMTEESIEASRAFWQSASERNLDISMQQIPTFLRQNLGRGYTLAMLEQQKIRWLQGEHKGKYQGPFWLEVLNDLIEANLSRSTPKRKTAKRASGEASSNVKLTLEAAKGIKRTRVKSADNGDNGASAASSAAPTKQRQTVPKSGARCFKSAALFANWRRNLVHSGAAARARRAADVICRYMAVLMTLEHGAHASLSEETCGALVIAVFMVMQVAVHHAAEASQRSLRGTELLYATLLGGVTVPVSKECYQCIQACFNLIVNLHPEGAAALVTSQQTCTHHDARDFQMLQHSVSPFLKDGLINTPMVLEQRAREAIHAAEIELHLHGAEPQRTLEGMLEAQVADLTEAPSSPSVATSSAQHTSLVVEDIHSSDDDMEEEQALDDEEDKPLSELQMDLV